MFGNKILIQGIFCLMSLQAPFTCQASTWKVVSAAFGGVDGTFLGGKTFSDGQFNTSPDVFDWNDNIFSIGDHHGFSFHNWGCCGRGGPDGTYDYMIPPQVDIASMRANFSSLFVAGFGTENPNIPHEQMMHWEIGSHNWVPITDNVNSTYTATWVTPATLDFPDANFGGRQFSMTFSLVPIPAAVWMMGSALLSLIGLNSFARKRLSQN